MTIKCNVGMAALALTIPAGVFGAKGEISTGVESAEAVIERFVHKANPTAKSNVELKLAKETSCTDGEWYETKVVGGKLIVTASTPIALCHGFYAATKAQKRGICGWAGNRFADGKWEMSAAVKGATPFKYRYYFNVVTYGYTMPYWTWERWAEEIDYMALHGINSPITLVAQEAIMARVFQKLGLKDDEIQNYFVGPAHLPWMRMGNISGLDSPMPKEWHADQVALQHKILAKMRALGMTPIAPGFAGFVPPGLKRLYPDLELIETKWCGGVFHNWMLMPNHPLFAKIGTMFIQEWQREFGVFDHYLIDSFNEMETPFPPKGSKERYDLMNEYGEKVYKSIAAANPNAIWVMQGWMFGFQRGVWDYETLSALMKYVPDDKMLLIDEAVDYNRHFWHNGANWDLHKGYSNKLWIYSVIPNMGGKCGLTGMLDFYANGHLDALSSPNRGRLVGHGMAPEGIENNQVVYEIMSDAAWRTERADIRALLRDYSAARYGGDGSDFDEFWDLMLKSVYGSFTDHPRYNWQFRPGGGGKGSINAKDEFFAAIEKFVALAEKYQNERLYRADLLEFAAASVGGRVEQLIVASERSFNEGNVELAKDLEERITKLMTAMDRVLASHPHFSLDRWIAFARSHANGESKLADYYEKNARRIVTIWGPPVDDYAAKIWSGLIRDYYLPRRANYNKGRFNPSERVNLGAWERAWVENTTGLSPARPYKNPTEAAARLVREAKKMAEVELGGGKAKSVGSWTPGKPGKEWSELKFAVDAGDLRAARAVRCTYNRGNQRLEIGEIKVIMDGSVVAKTKSGGYAGKPSHGNELPIKITDPSIGNNGCSIVIKARILNDGNSYGTVELLMR